MRSRLGYEVEVSSLNRGLEYGYFHLLKLRNSVIKPRHLPECHQCQMNAQSNYLVCAIHPVGYAGDSCPDFAKIPGLIEELWRPVGYSYYDGDLIPDSNNNLLREEQIWMLDAHPMFTRKCPECGAKYDESPRIHWDCLACDWMDDSVV